MPEPSAERVAVYIDFDNIVISRYDQLHGRSTWRADNARGYKPGDGDIPTKLAAATVDVGAILDYASSFGTIAISRAYADWSVPANASYRGQLLGRAVDLTQLFPTAGALKNGADIRLSVDAIEDLFRLPDLTHVVIVAGDSDYIALAQRVRRLNREVIGVGVSGGTSQNLIAACDEYKLYDDLPGLSESDVEPSEVAAAAREAAKMVPPTKAVPEKKSSTAATAASEPSDDNAPTAMSPQAASKLLVRALELGHEKDDAEWLNASGVKQQIRRMNPSFNEKALGYANFTDFVTSRNGLVEMKVDGLQRFVRLRPTKKLTAKKVDTA